MAHGFLMLGPSARPSFALAVEVLPKKDAAYRVMRAVRILANAAFREGSCIASRASGMSRPIGASGGRGPPSFSWTRIAWIASSMSSGLVTLCYRAIAESEI